MSTGAIVIACIIAGVPLIFGFIMYVSTAFQHPLGDTLSPLSFIPSACIAALPTMICYAICKNIEDAKAEKKDK